jgi:hypothetical protein
MTSTSSISSSQRVELMALSSGCQTHMARITWQQNTAEDPGEIRQKKRAIPIFWDYEIANSNILGSQNGKTRIIRDLSRLDSGL